MTAELLKLQTEVEQEYKWNYLAHVQCHMLILQQE